MAQSNVISQSTNNDEQEKALDVSQLIQHKLGNAPTILFRYCQIGFWAFSCFISYTTLTLWYGQYDIAHFSHIIVQALFGLALSLFMQKAFLWSWNKSNWFRLAYSFLLVVLVSLLWTIARMLAFIHMTDEQDIWWNFGGWYFTGIFIFSCWSAMFYGVIYYQLLQVEHQTLLDTEAKSNIEHLKRIEAQNIAREAQLKMLRYQLNPHFLSNSLNAINSLIEVQENNKAQQMVVNLSRFLRYSLDNDPDIKVTLAQEIKTLELYLQIEKVRFGDRLEFEFDIDEQANSALIPSLILQPIVENSMKHAIAKNEDGGTIRLTAEVINKQLCLQLSDTGSGLEEVVDQSAFDQPRGVGLRNIRARLTTLYPEGYTFELKQLDTGGLLAHICVPYQN
ncbi:sensor histidine kinase [Catenovulum agarivorans DS-2]|uniref:Sensor histidine kinase n=1 Tax=Catenovulum agarivorans DS-2 TaxID=1328313 RepID=W7QFA0_9ALTE|nr:histidine kinase [Catenovulum agarivorans]EWH10576.1 sensor histidine kinase [Catenovulum agarivorans DS-2]